IKPKINLENSDIRSLAANQPLRKNSGSSIFQSLHRVFHANVYVKKLSHPLIIKRLSSTHLHQFLFGFTHLSCKEIKSSTPKVQSIINIFLNPDKELFQTEAY